MPLLFRSRAARAGGWLCAGWLTCAALPASAWASSPLLAQTVVAESKNYILEIGIVAVLAGAALFAVCRTSNRS